MNKILNTGDWMTFAGAFQVVGAEMGICLELRIVFFKITKYLIKLKKI